MRFFFRQDLLGLNFKRLECLGIVELASVVVGLLKIGVLNGRRNCFGYLPRILILIVKLNMNLFAAHFVLI